jgi:hypothetical protein
MFAACMLLCYAVAEQFQLAHTPCTTLSCWRLHTSAKQRCFLLLHKKTNT